jgi:phospholipid/cholesterol/gamma-HCH transport system substrate-binding protein
METRAHYTLIGAFVLAFIAGAFGFIYWLQWGGGLNDRAYYKVKFEQPSGGLASLSAVTFNGVRVGNVMGLRLDPQNPKVLIASISVDPAAPIRADTQVELSYQGFTGAPVLALKGGSPDAPKLSSKDGPPLLVAKAGSGETLTDAARGTLGHLDKILDDNAKPLNTAITGFATFADMLGRNSGRIEGLIGGLEKLAGTGENAKKPITTFDLTAPSEFPPIKDIAAQMTVADLSATLVYDTQKMLIRTTDGTYKTLDGGEWADNLPKLVQAKVVQSFENAKQLKSVSRPIDDLQPEYKLELAIRGFQIVPGQASDSAPNALVEFSARLVGDKGEVKDAHIFKVTQPAQSMQPDAAAAALNVAFAKAAQELVAWTAGAI